MRFNGYITNQGCSVEVETSDDGRTQLDTYLNEVNHSSTAFAWGYGGSGPAQLTYAIFRKVLARKVPATLYQAFKWDVISNLHFNGPFRLDDQASRRMAAATRKSQSGLTLH